MNPIIETEPSATARKYRFQSSYEISINDCRVRGSINRNGKKYVHLDLTGSEAQTTISNFVTEIAASVGLKRDIKISNLALELDGPIVHRGRADVVIEWTSFTVDGQDIILNLKLTSITQTTTKPKLEPKLEPKPEPPLDCFKPIDPKLVPKLYQTEKGINISINLN